MVSRKLLIGFSCLLLCGCAQVGFLTGGEEDTTAPEPTQTSPENGAINFSGHQVTLGFDEFVQLKDPQQNIFIVPDDAKIEAKLQKKELVLSWQEQLQPNTTYVIYLNNAVVDASEGNSTLWSFVFSTGAELDTLSRVFRVVNAASNTVEAKTTVGLFTEKDTLKPLYFSMTDALGFAAFKYLKPGNYDVRAFQDENKDLQIGVSEKCGFLSDPVTISPSETDTLTLQLFSPNPTKWISRFDFKAPGILEVELAAPVKDPHFLLNDIRVDTLQIRKVNDVVYRLIPGDSVKQTNHLLLESGAIKDSASVRVSTKERIAANVITPSIGSFNPNGSPLKFQLNTEIHQLDTSKVHISAKDDSLKKFAFRAEYRQDLIYIWPELTNGGAYTVTFKEGAINGNSKPLSALVEIKTKKELGTLLLQPSGFEGPIIIELMKDNKPVEKQVLPSANEVLFENLLPGDYTIRVTEDRNKNGLWDTGDIHLNIQPEKINFFNAPVRIRPNWDVKLTIKAQK